MHISLPQLPAIAFCAPPTRSPGPPENYSYSSLKEAEACPRQWSLRRARYPSVWQRSGFPGRPHPKTVAGSVIHRTIEVVVGLLANAGCTSFHDPRTAAVLKEAGGWTQLLRRCADDVLNREVNNPRLPGGFEAFAKAVKSEVPDLRLRVQAVVSRLQLLPRSGRNERTEKPLSMARSNLDTSQALFGERPVSEAEPLETGTYSELKIEVPALRFVGTADMLTVGAADDGCQIDDFKTGISRDEHAKQLQLYSLLWSRDSIHNPAGRRVTRLRVRYEGGDNDIAVLTDTELDELEADLRERMAASSASLAAEPPDARPHREICGYCDVRQMCDRYWTQEVQSALEQEQASSFSNDLQVRVAAARGGMMWDATVEVGRGFKPGEVVLLRATEANASLDHALAAKLSARVLGASVSPPTTGVTTGPAPRVVNIYPRSETFVVPAAHV